ncbi:MAG TPA: hypothetical protein PKD86_08480 [Gemmatales bacterium]|nr:hypothetical protein [Gemmatales bacterium]HMP59375.1 hypothetical protein [Gemmatales bacterium]
MNTTINPRILWLVLALFVGLVAVVVVGQQVLSGLEERDLDITRLKGEVAQLVAKRADLEKKQARVREWQAVSLPPDPTIAAARYRAFLLERFQKHGLEVKKRPAETQVRGTSRGGNLTVPLMFDVTVEGTYPKLLGFLKDFYSINLLHAIKEIGITPLAAGADGKLEVAIKFEALSIPGATNRNFLLAAPNPRVIGLEFVTGLKGGPVGLGLALSQLAPTGLFGRSKLAQPRSGERDYLALTARNVFAGLTPPVTAAAGPASTAPTAPDRQVLDFTQLTSVMVNNITPIYSTVEASLRNRMTNDYITLRAEPARDTFEVRDTRRNLVLKGKVVSITPPHTVVFQVEGKFYALRVGEFLGPALKKELTEAEVKALQGTATAQNDGEQ